MLRVGVFGAGALAKSHLATLRCPEDVSVGALYDPVRKRAESLARPRDAAVCESYTEMFDRTGAIWICAPPGERRGRAGSALEAHRFSRIAPGAKYIRVWKAL